MTHLYIRQNLNLASLASLAAEPGVLPGFVAWVDGYGRYTSVSSGTFAVDGYHVINGYANSVQWADDYALLDGYNITLTYTPTNYNSPLHQIIGEHLKNIDIKLGVIAEAGDVAGPVSATDNSITRFDGYTGKIIQNSDIQIDDAGNLLVNSHEIQNVKTVDFNATLDSETIPYQEGRLFYDSINRTLSLYRASVNHTLEIGQEQALFVNNNSGVFIANGSPVCISGYLANIPTVALASATNQQITRCIGLATEDIYDGQNGYITISGFVHDIDTSTYQVQDILYLDVTPGTLTKIPPLTEMQVKVGIVTEVSATNGIILVGVDVVRNIFDDGYFQIYDSLDNSKLIQFELSAITHGNIRVLTIPDRNITLGNILGPVSLSSTDHALVRWDGTTGQLVQNSSITVSDTGIISNVTLPVIASDAATKGYVDGYFALNLSNTTPYSEVAGGIGYAGILTTVSRADHVHPMPAFGTTSGTFAQGNDTRFSDARTPLAHESTHISGGSDVIIGYNISLIYSPINYTNTIDGYLGQHITNIDTKLGLLSSGVNNIHLDGYVSGPVSSTDTAIARYNGTTGKLIQNSSATIDGSGNITAGTYNGVTVATHHSRHENGGVDALDGYNISITYTPVSYNTPSLAVIGQHFYNIDKQLGTILFNDGTYVVGPASSTDTAIARYNGITGKLIQDSSITIDGSGNLTLSTGNIILSGSGATVDGVDVSSHHVRHESLGADQIDGYKIVISYTPTNYTPVGLSPNNIIGQHFYHIDQKFGDVVTAAASYVVGPASSTDTAIARYNGITGKLIQNSSATIDGSGNITAGTYNGVTVATHHARHENGGDDVLDGYNISIAYSPTNYTNPNPAIIGQHFYNIDQKLGTIALNEGTYVVGSASSTDTAIVRYNGTTGKLIQNSSATIDGSGNITAGTYNGVTVATHHTRHESGGADALDGYNISIAYSPTNYTAPINAIIGEHISRIDKSLFKKTVTIEFTLTEDVNNTTQYFYTWRSTGTDATTAGKRSSTSTGMQNTNSCNPFQVPFNATVVKALLTVRGVGVQNGSVTYPVSYQTNLISVGFTNDSSLGSVNFSISNSFTVGTYSVGNTNFKGSTSLNINVNEGDMLGLKFINGTGASTAGQTRMAFVTLILEAR